MLRNLVCSGCNHLFSTYERAWTSAPDIAIARIAQGPPGRTRKGQAYQFHPSERMFLVADGDPVAYEVDLLPGIEPRLRYQLIDTGVGMEAAASSQDDDSRFRVAWNSFVARPEVTIQKKPSGTGSVFRVASLDLSGPPKVTKVETRTKPALAWWDTFDNAVPGPIHARLSLDPFGRIRFRTGRLREVPKLLDNILQAGTISSRGKSYAPGTYSVSARSVYDINKVNRAVAKTLMNYATDQFGSAFASKSEFNDLRQYCLGGPDRQTNGLFVGLVTNPIGIPTIDLCASDRHALALASDGFLVVGVLKLYGHFTYRVHLGPAPPGTIPFVRGVRVDFNGPGRTDAVNQ